MNTVHIVFTTHWDREWIQSREQYRFRLVNLFDNLLGILQRERELVFMFDGQTIVLEDYLAVRPERREPLQRLARAGRILFGPWYVLSDSFLEGAEAMVRNLLTGHRLAANFGGVMKEGYNPDSFGTVATMPMILNGFGIRHASFGRGLAHVTNREQRLFNWEWKDGSRVLAISCGYGDGILIAYPDLNSDVVRNRPTSETVLKALRNALGSADPGFPAGQTYISVGIDHMEMRPGMQGLLKNAARILGRSIRFSSPDEFFNESEKVLRRSRMSLETVQGEMRGEPGHPMDLQGVLSTDLKLKQRNRANEVMLGCVLEPLAAVLAAVTGQAVNPTLHHAWKLLVASHAHDSICACSRDEVMQDIHARMRHVSELALIARERWLRTLGDAGDPGAGFDPGLLLFNTQLRRGLDHVEGLARVHGRLPEDHYRVVDMDGSQVGQARVVARRQIDLETYYATDAGCVELEAKAAGKDVGDDRTYSMLQFRLLDDFGAHAGFRGYYLIPGCTPGCGSRHDAVAGACVPDACAACGLSGDAGGIVVAGDNLLENELVRVSVGADGRVTLKDKKTSVIHRNLGWFEDMADAGDTYDFVPLGGDVSLRSYEGAKVTGRAVASDGNSASLEVTTRWSLPAGLDGVGRRDRRVNGNDLKRPMPEPDGRRTRRTIPHTLVTRYTLHGGMDRLEVCVRVRNQSEQHRLRLGFGLRGRPGLWAGGHFAVMKRDWVARSHQFSFQPFTDFLHVETGLAIMVKGLYEYEQRRVGRGGELFLTLFRSVDTIGPAAGCNYDVEHSKELKEFCVEYALSPSSGVAETARKAAAYVTPVLAEGVETVDAAARLPGRLVSASNPALILSAMKPAENGTGTVVRFWNTSGRRQKTVVTFGLPFKTVQYVDLSETRLTGLGPVVKNGRVSCEVAPYGVVSLTFV